MRHAQEFLTQIVDARGYSQGTARAYAAAIADFERTMGIGDPAAVTTRDFDRYLTRKALQGRSLATRRSRINALRSFFRFLATRQILPSDPAADVRGPQERSWGIPTFTQGEIVKLLFHVHEPPERGLRENDIWYARRKRVAALSTLRDSAMLGLMYSCGLRVAEVGKLPLEAYRQDARGHRTISLWGKGAREPQIFPVEPRVAAMLDAFLTARLTTGILHPSLFCPLVTRRRSAQDRSDGLGTDRVYDVLVKRAHAAGIEPRGRRISPHILRYSVATHLHENGLGVFEIKEFMRHRSIETTFKYVRLGSARTIRRRAISRLPWNRRTRLPPDPEG